MTYFKWYPGSFSSPEPTILLACGRNRELWEQPFQACAIDEDCVKLDGQNSVISFVISKWLLQELLSELSIPAAGQKDRRLWGREWPRLAPGYEIWHGTCPLDTISLLVIAYHRDTIHTAFKQIWYKQHKMSKSRLKNRFFCKWLQIKQNTANIKAEFKMYFDFTLGWTLFKERKLVSRSARCQSYPDILWIPNFFFPDSIIFPSTRS